jgi:hypothetical protein
MSNGGDVVEEYLIKVKHEGRAKNIKITAENETAASLKAAEQGKVVSVRLIK